MNTVAATPDLLHRLRRLTDTFGGAMLGAVPYALWALFVNWQAGPAMAWRAAATHWLVSTTLTYVDAANMRLFFGLGRTRRHSIVLAFSAGMALTYTVLFAAHTIVGTPHILLTLAAGLIPNILYCSGYAVLLAKTSRSAQASEPIHSNIQQG
jgi:hypothetical protein